MIKSFLEFVMRSRRNAAIMALLFTLIPFLDFISKIIIGLVTLREGAKDGLWILLWGVLPLLVIALSSSANVLVWQVVIVYGLVWVLAIVLRNTTSWGKTLEYAAAFGVIVVVLFHLLVPDPIAWWHVELPKLLNQMMIMQPGYEQTWLANGEQSNVLKIITGVLVASTLFSVLFNLVLARAAQSTLYNPGAIKTELYNIRLGIVSAAVMFVVLLAALFQMNIAIDILPVLLLVFTIAGISLLHVILITKSKQTTWTVLLIYTSLIFVSLFIMLYVVITIVLIAIIDSFLNLRKKLAIVA